MKPAEIAKRLGIRYQHAYNVLNAQSAARTASIVHKRSGVETASPGSATKPPLQVDILVARGFRRVGSWILSGDRLVLERPVPNEFGVYAFVKAGTAQYVGVATMGLSKRLYFYGGLGFPSEQANG